MPRQVKVLIGLLFATAAVTAAVEALNWWLGQGDYGLFVRTTWALLRSAGFLLLIWQVRRGRTSAPAFALILSVTTLFALGRLVVPKQGLPTLPGVLGFALVAALCTVTLLLFYRSKTIRGYLSKPPSRIVIDRRGVDWRPVPSRRPPTPGWLLTIRVAALSYAPLILVACAVALGQVFRGRLDLLPLILSWFAGGLILSYLIGLLAIFVVRGKPWARALLAWLTVAVLAIHLPLCWLILGSDGLFRDGGPLLVSALLVLFGLSRSTHWSPTPPA